MAPQCCIEAHNKFKTYLNNRTFVPQKYRGVLIGGIANLVIYEVCIFILLQATVKAGDLPAYAPDVIIMSMAMLEFLISPFLSWIGYTRRRTVMICLMPASLLSVFLWFMLPKVNQEEGSELCPAHPVTTFETITRATAIRLGIIIFTCLVILVTRIAVWCHGLAYLEEHRPEKISMHLGVLIFVRLQALVATYAAFGVSLTNIHKIIFILSYLLPVVQLLFYMPSSTTKKQQGDIISAQGREFCASVARVISNRLMMIQIISLSLLVAAVWGYSYNASDIIKVKFLLPQNKDMRLIGMELHQYYGVLLAILYIGLRWSKPIQEQFCKLRAVKQALTMSLLSGVFLVLLMVGVNCEHGRIAGLQDDLYTQPNCSVECGCNPLWYELSPVCAVEDMTTYLSPCHAGCQAEEEVGGLIVYRNCTCSPSSIVMAGECGAYRCDAPRAVFRFLYILLLTFAALSFQAQLVPVLRAADARDKAVALGVAGALVALIAFVLGHAGYYMISLTTCIWRTKRCNLHSSEMPWLVSIVSIVLAFASAAISLGTLIWLKVQARGNPPNTEEAELRSRL